MEKMYQQRSSTNWLGAGMLLLGLFSLPTAWAQVGISLSSEGIDGYVNISGGRMPSSGASPAMFWVKINGLPQQAVGRVDKGYGQGCKRCFLQGEGNLHLGQSFSTPALTLHLYPRQWPFHVQRVDLGGSFGYRFPVAVSRAGGNPSAWPDPVGAWRDRMGRSVAGC